MITGNVGFTGVRALYGSHEIIKKLQKATLNLPNLELTDATLISSVSKKNMGELSDAANKGEEVIFVITGKKDFDRRASLLDGWITIYDLNKKLKEVSKLTEENFQSIVKQVKLMVKK